MSPGRALREVKARLQSFASKGTAGAGRAAGGGDGLILAARPAPAPAAASAAAGGGGSELRAPMPAGGGDTYADASAEIQDIDARLQSLQNFLKAAKSGQPVRSPVAP